MRAEILIFGVFSAILPMQARGLDSDVYSLNPPPVPPTALVSFSIGYPKGWEITEEPGHQRQDVYYDILTANYHTDIICKFWPVVWPVNTINHTNWTDFTVYRSGGATAKEAANGFLESVRRLGIYKERSLSPVKTSAGDSGYLVECRANLKIFNLTQTSPPKMKGSLGKVPFISHDFFFHSGTKGAIRISILTPAADSSWRSQLDQLVLQTLRFNAP